MSLAPATLQCAHHLCMALSNGVEGTTYEGWSDPSFDFVTLRGKREQLARVAVFLASHGVKLSTSARSHADIVSRAQVAAIAVADIARKLGRDGYTGERIATPAVTEENVTAVITAVEGATHYRARTRAQAEDFCIAHNVPVADMLTDLGDHESYDSRALLVWMGY